MEEKTLSGVCLHCGQPVGESCIQFRNEKGEVRFLHFVCFYLMQEERIKQEGKSGSSTGYDPQGHFFG